MAGPLPEHVIDVATADAVVNVSWSGPTAAATITRIAVAGRPTPRPYQGEGNHTTAFAVYGDVLRRQMLGLTRAQAGVRLLALVNDVQTPAERDRLARSIRRSRFLDAATRCRNALIAANLGGGDARTQFALAMRAFLSCANFAPLASGWLGAGRAVGAGETKPLRRLRRNEAPAAPDLTAAEMREAVWSLLDRRVLQHILDDDIAGVPGVPAATVAARRTAVVDVVGRHLTAIALAYPVSYFESSVSDDAQVIAYLDTIGLGPWPDHFPGVPDPVGGVAAASAGWSEGTGPGARVSLEYSTAGGGSITAVRAKGRGLTTRGEQGHHLTAHVVFERHLALAVVGRTLAAARTELLLTVATIDTMPNWPRVGGPVEPIPAGEDYGERFDVARTALTAEVTALTAAADPGAVYDGLCRVAAAYLDLRNAVPLVAVKLGGNSDGDAEATARSKLDVAEPDPQPEDVDMIHACLWRLFDLEGAAPLVFTMTEADLYDTSPGAPADPLVRLATALATHRESVDMAWPNAYLACEFGTRSSLYAALDAMGVYVGPRPAFAVLAGFTGDGPDRLPLKVSAEIAADDEELAAKGKGKRKVEDLPPREKSTRKKAAVDYTRQPSIGSAETERRS